MQASRIGRALGRFGRAVRRHPLLTLAAVPLALAVYVAAHYPFTPSIGDIRKAKEEHPTVVLSADGQELAVFRRANRDWVDLEEIAPPVIDALLATEDHRFYEHHGIDLVRTAKAFLNTLRGDVEGGSTLTQQLARNLYPAEIGRERTITRKIKEAITALKIEAIYSKDEILETYLNSVSFLYNAWGIEMAARTYFDKPASELDVVEAATLVGMLKGTSYYNPVLNPERALQRRNTVLAQMARRGKLPAARHAQLSDRPLKLDFARVPEFRGPAPHLAQDLKRWLLDWADRHDYNIYADGLVVRTTIDARLQAIANEAVRRQGDALQAVADVEWATPDGAALGTRTDAYVARRGRVEPFAHFWDQRPELLDAFVRDTVEYRALREQGLGAQDALAQLRSDPEFMQELRRDRTRLQAGFLAMDPHTGHVKAWVGSRGFEEDQFDHVQQARRQPGSTFKPFVYGAAFEMGLTPWDAFMDEPVEIRVGRDQVWRPGDPGGPTNAPMTLREGLAQSRNSIAAQLMMQVGPSRVAQLARDMGVRESKLEVVPSLALGTSPVTLKEMVTAFSTIASGGSYVEPVVVTAIEDRDGRVLERFAPPVPEPALDHDAALALLDVMRDVIEGGTGQGLQSRFGLRGDLAGKTGTTQDNADGWFILMHPQLVAGAWMGFNDARVRMRSEYWGQGAHNALLVVGDFFKEAIGDTLLDAKAVFPAPRLEPPPRPLLEQMGDWWSGLFGAPVPPQEEVATEPAQEELAALPPVPLEPFTEAVPLAEPPLPPPSARIDTPGLLPPPARIDTPGLLPPPARIDTPGPLPPPARIDTPGRLPPPAPPVASLPPGPRVPPDAPVVVDPLRVPAFPPVQPARPVETVPGTRVYPRAEPPAAGAPAPGLATPDPRERPDPMLVPRPWEPPLAGQQAPPPQRPPAPADPFRTAPGPVPSTGAADFGQEARDIGEAQEPREAPEIGRAPSLPGAGDPLLAPDPARELLPPPATTLGASGSPAALP